MHAGIQYLICFLPDCLVIIEKYIKLEARISFGKFHEIIFNELLDGSKEIIVFLATENTEIACIFFNCTTEIHLLCKFDITIVENSVKYSIIVCNLHKITWWR